MPQRGEIWWVELVAVVGREQAGRRPAVVVSSNDFLETGARRAAVVPITTKFRDLPSWVPINPTMGNLKPSRALPDQIRTVDFAQLVKSAGSVDTKTLKAIESILRLVLDFRFASYPVLAPPDRNRLLSEHCLLSSDRIDECTPLCCFLALSLAEC